MKTKYICVSCQVRRVISMLIVASSTRIVVNTYSRWDFKKNSFTLILVLRRCTQVKYLMTVLCGAKNGE